MAQGDGQLLIDAYRHQVVGQRNKLIAMQDEHWIPAPDQIIIRWSPAVPEGGPHLPHRAQEVEITLTLLDKYKAVGWAPTIIDVAPTWAAHIKNTFDLPTGLQQLGYLAVDITLEYRYYTTHRDWRRPGWLLTI